jgi:uncharacterized protein with HEPN domain
MTPEERDPAHLLDMIEAARTIVRYVQGRSLADNLGDEMLQDAVERNVEIIGEAARRVSASFQAAHPEIAWRGIIAQRHVLAHDYGRIQHDRIWRVATIHVPELIVRLEPLIPAPPPAD